MNIDMSNISIIRARHRGHVYNINIKDIPNIKNNIAPKDFIRNIEDYLGLNSGTFDSYEICTDKITSDLVIKPRSKFV